MNTIITNGFYYYWFGIISTWTSLVHYTTVHIIYSKNSLNYLLARHNNITIKLKQPYASTVLRCGNYRH